MIAMMEPEDYRRADVHPTLESGTVHIWRVPIGPWPDDRAVWPPAADLALLSSEERSRAERFHFVRHRNRSIAARAALRRLLGRYTGIAPEQLAFGYGLQGKPELSEPLPAQSIAFNVAHSRDLAMYAFARDVRVGVDVEWLRPMPQALNIARRFFTADEAQLLHESSDPGNAFLRMWTRKEAVIKAVGTGLAMPLDEFDVSSAGDSGVWRTVRVPAQPDIDWAVRDVPTAPNYRAALTVEGAALDVSFWEEA